MALYIRVLIALAVVANAGVCFAENRPPEAERLTRLQDLQLRIDDQNFLVKAAQLKVEQVKSYDIESTHPSALRELIAQEKKKIASLQDSLATIRNQRIELQRQSHANQAKLAQEQKQSNERITAQIGEQQQTLSALKSQLSEATKNYNENIYDASAVAKISDLKAQVATQKESIENLRDQRSADSAQRSFALSTSLYQFQLAIDDLAVSQGSLEGDLVSEQNILQSLENQYLVGIQTANTYQFLQKEAETDYELQKSILDRFQARYNLLKNR